MAARGYKYTPDRVKRFTDAVAVGATYQLAAKYAGISDDTYRNWMLKYPAFKQAVADAEGRAAVGWLAKIEAEASNGNWTAAAWKLERRYPESYGRRVTDVQGSMAVTIRDYIDEGSAD
jgi:hypothetical protein